jgi:hypothetical protein
LDQVVGEGIVVIDHHHVGSTTFDAPFAASVCGDGGWIGRRIVHTDDSTSLQWTLTADLMSPAGSFPPIVFVANQLLEKRLRPSARFLHDSGPFLATVLVDLNWSPR